MPRCAWCGEKWQNCYDATYDPSRTKSPARTYQDQTDGTPWNHHYQTDSGAGHQNWQQGQGRGNQQNPRPRSRRHRGRGRGQAQHHGHAHAHGPPPPPQIPKGDGKGMTQQPLAHAGPPLPPPPPLTLLAPVPAQSAPGVAAAPSTTTWNQPMPVDATYAPQPADPSAAEVRLRTVMKELKQAPKEMLTPALQEEIKKDDIQEDEAAIKGVHRATNDIKKARKAVSLATSARAKLMSDWKTFLQQSVATWREYTNMFQTQERALKENLDTAIESLAAARRNFTTLSESLQESGIQEISDEDKEPTEMNLDSETTKRLHEGLATIVTNLQDLSEKAELEEQQAKRFKKSEEPTEEAPVSNAAGTGALQPFGQAGRQ